MIWWEKDEMAMSQNMKQIKGLIVQIEQHLRSIGHARSNDHYAHYDCRHSPNNHYTLAWTKDGLTYNREGEEPVLLNTTELEARDYFNVTSVISILEKHLRNTVEIASLELIAKNLEHHFKKFTSPSD